MNVSLHLASQYSNVDFNELDRSEVIARIGAQLGAIEEVVDIGARYQGVVIAKVVSCEKHPNADKLNVCLIDDGGVTENIERTAEGLVQVVCGAPNVRTELLVAWLPPGSTVPSSFTSDPFVLGARELRGVVSNGMLASPSELALSDNHDGILEIDDSAAQPGSSFAKLYGLNDLVIDCENKMFTHRPDCFGVLGVARELAGIFGKQFESPNWYRLDAEAPVATSELELVSKNDVPTKVPRFMLQVIENIAVTDSSVQVQSWLNRSGSRPINNIVDATNFYMQLTAQPTHAFDYDKVKALCGDTVTIFPRMAVKGEKLELLNGKTVTLTEDDIVIATDKQAIALAGVMGGAATEVDETTKNIVIECANFDMYTIRRTSMRHGIFSDAVTRFNKGQSPLQNPVVLSKIVADICSQTGAVAGQRFDSAPEESQFTWEPVAVTTAFINERLGSSLSAEIVQSLLVNVEFDVEIQDETVIVTPPFWRRDIEIPEDIVEEVGRLLGYDKLDIQLPRRSTAATSKNENVEFKSRLRTILSRAGANEVVTYSFVSGKLLEAAGQNKAEAYQLSNALSPELQYYRLTLTPSLLAKIYPNIRAGYDSFAIFELGKSHIKGQGVNDEGLPLENALLSFVFSGNDSKVAKDAGAAYFNARAYLQYTAEQLGITLDFAPIETEPTYEITKPYDWQRSALVTDRATGNYIGIIGEFKASVRKALKLPVHTAGFEVMLQPLLESSRTLYTYSPLSRFPGITQDISFKADKSQSYGQLAEMLEKAVANLSAEQSFRTNLSPVDIYHKDKSPQKHITFRLALTHPDRTLTTTEVNAFIDAVVQTVESQVDVKRI